MRFQKIKSHLKYITISGSYVIPDEVTHLEGGAFESCEELTEIFLPPGIRMIGQFAFVDCPNLTRLVSRSNTCYFNGQIMHGCPNLQFMVQLAVQLNTMQKGLTFLLPQSEYNLCSSDIQQMQHYIKIIAVYQTT